MMIKENIAYVYREIQDACLKSGRDPKDVSLIAVSKTKPVDMIKEAYDCGVHEFGENKVKELLEKEPLLPDNIKWHMIGHLQTNKVRQVIGKTVLIHSIDSMKLSDTIDCEARKKGIVVDGLLEINVAKEESKYGFYCEELNSLLDRLKMYRNLKIRGLMTVAPNVTNPEENRNIFQKLRQLSVDMKRQNVDNVTMEFLSMGMTGDYRIAVEEGATFIRVGTGIFGERHYKM